ncbi:MAG: M48 family metalloprotease [Pseudomonadota bacterium]
MFRRVGLWVAALTAALGISACQPTAQNTAQSLAQEQRNAQNLVAQLDRKGQLIKEAGLNRYVNDVVARVAQHRPPGSVPVRAYVIKDAAVNAFTPGGGYVFFNAGLIAAMENEAQFATVVAHEIAHIDQGHIPAKIANNQAVQLGAIAGMLLGAATGIDPRVTETFVGVGANAYASNYSRTQERDADRVAIEYLAAAGYNAVEGAKSFQVLQRLYGSNADLFSTHPASGERFTNLTAQAQRLGATRGRVGNRTHDRATLQLRRDILDFYQSKGMTKEAAQVRRALR